MASGILRGRHRKDSVGHDVYARQHLTGPYFHDGSAATLQDVVNHYMQNFGLGLTAQQQSDLVEYLKTL